MTFMRIFTHSLTYLSTGGIGSLQNALFCGSCKVIRVCSGIPWLYRVAEVLLGLTGLDTLVFGCMLPADMTLKYVCMYQLKHIRSVLCCDAVDVSELHQQLRSLDVGLHVSVKNLRSQVVREACITIASASYFISCLLLLLFEPCMMCICGGRSEYFCVGFFLSRVCRRAMWIAPSVYVWTLCKVT